MGMLDQIGPYRGLKYIGDGGMATVFRAWSDRFGDVALKVPKPHVDMRRFHVEKHVWQALHHPNIVRLYDSSAEHDPQQYIALEYVPVPDLERLLAARRRLSPVAIARIGVGVCLALDHAYRNTDIVVHRDIKPGNIFAEVDGDEVTLLKLTDFGIVRLKRGVTIGPESLGCPWYAPPEQSEPNARLDQTADIYALGVTFYELATGRCPFEGESAYHIIYAHRTQRPTPPRALEPSIPRHLEDVILHCLEKDPGRRPRTTVMLAQELEALAGGASWAPPAADLLPPEPGPQGVGARSSAGGVVRLALGGTMTLAALGGALLALIELGKKDLLIGALVGAAVVFAVGFGLALSGIVSLLSAGREDGRLPAPGAQWGTGTEPGQPVQAFGLTPSSIPAASLLALSGPFMGTRFQLLKQYTTLGRAPGLDIVLPMDDLMASRKHAHIACDGSEFTAVDDGSGNGTFVDNQRVYDRLALRSGSVVQAGQSLFRFELGGDAGPGMF